MMEGYFERRLKQLAAGYQIDSEDDLAMLGDAAEYIELLVAENERLTAENERLTAELEQNRWVSVKEHGLPKIPKGQKSIDCMIRYKSTDIWDVVQFWGDPRMDRDWSVFSHYKVLNITPPEGEG